MEKIRFFGLADLSTTHYVERCRSALSNLDSLGDPVGINDAITLFNIQRYADAGLASEFDEQTLQKTRQLVGQFGNTLSSRALGDLYGEVEPVYHDEFWVLFASYRWFQKYSKENFDTFLVSTKPSIRPILKQKVLLKEYRDQIKAYFISAPINAAIFIESKNKSSSSSVTARSHLPEGLTTAEIQDLFNRYVNDPDCAYGHLEIIANMHEVSDKTKLKARRKAKDMAASIFSEANGFTYGVEVRYVEQEKPVALEFENSIAKYSYDINWFSKEIEEPTILNNFIYLFEYLDKFGRVTLAAYKSEVAIIERLFNTERSDWYPVSIVFIQKNQAALMQLYSYAKILEVAGTRMENVLEWFFSDYLKDTYEISGFHVTLPGPATTYSEKCRIIAPEIERIVKQYSAYVRDGEIDQELLSIGSQPTPVTTCPSLVANKYAYGKSEHVDRAIYYFFSDQCMLSYESSTQTSHKDFFTRIRVGSIPEATFDAYLLPDLEWLISNRYLAREPDGALTLLSTDKVLILRDLYLNESIVCNKYPEEFRSIIDAMIDGGELSVEADLFTRAEKDYFDYHLNKSNFINSLDLRNRYAHGSLPSSSPDEGEFELDYNQLLKLVVLIVLKINDDFEQRGIQIAKAAEV